MFRFPKFHVPRIDMRLWIDSIILAFVVFCVVYSGEKVIAKKHNYKISPRTVGVSTWDKKIVPGITGIVDRLCNFEFFHVRARMWRFGEDCSQF